MYQLTKKFPQKRAFITGAASGLGKAFCLALAKEGWTIGICDISEDKLQLTAKEINALGGRSLAYGLDVADEDNYKTVAENFLAETKGIDLLINNAGVGDGTVFEDYSLNNWKWMVGINQMGVIYGCHFFIPVMKKQQAGQIINIASAAAFSSAATMSPYNVTKAAVLSLSESLYAEITRDNLNISVVMPTFFRTDIVQHAKGNPEEIETAKLLLATSGLEAEKVADYILKKAGNKKFYIILPKRAKLFYVIKRFFPRFFLWFNTWLYENRAKLKHNLRKKYEKLEFQNK
jgi:short-subunit dehydrogenase